MNDRLSVNLSRTEIVASLVRSDINRCGSNTNGINIHSAARPGCESRDLPLLRDVVLCKREIAIDRYTNCSSASKLLALTDVLVFRQYNQNAGSHQCGTLSHINHEISSSRSTTIMEHRFLSQ